MDGVGFAGRMEVIEQPCGRRTWPVETKLRVVAESYVPGALVGEVARRHGLQPGQVTTWRRLYRQGELVPRGSPPLPPVVTEAAQGARMSPAPVAEPDVVVDAAPAFVPLMVAGEGVPPRSDDPPSPPAAPSAPSIDSGRIEFEVAGVAVRLSGEVSALRLAEVAAALRGLSDDTTAGRPA
ncbi:MAG: transposase [Pseudomonadota bacterium]